jgi:SAM-dependent methyltransferase
MDLSKDENILKRIRSICNEIDLPNLRIAFLGYTDLALTDREWRELGIDTEKLTVRPESDNLIKRHGRPDVRFIPTLGSALRCTLTRDFDVTVFDFIQHEGSELQRDFNLPLESDLHQKFDLVLDLGTCEHIFNLPQAFTNVFNLTKPGGFAFHAGPLCWPNHGFYGYNPTLFADFYEGNLAEIKSLFLEAFYFDTAGNRNRAVINNVPKYERFTMRQCAQQNPEFLTYEFNVNVAIKKSVHREVVYPIQARYR